jgi:TPP-dependent indolepyruvate ferredoxin oxidoreductase alpha subunit
MSYAGKRSLVCMKHVGLNVAADAFINSAITGVNGGLVVAVADDPIDAFVAKRAGQPGLRQICHAACT